MQLTHIALLALAIIATSTAPAHTQGAAGIARDAARGSKTARLSSDGLAMDSSTCARRTDGHLGQIRRPMAVEDLTR
jgi:hypothetical protein